MDRSKYEAEICQRLEQAERIPFRHVSTDGWEPTIAHCHYNVNEWVRRNPRDSAVRGWVTNGSFGAIINVTAHSVVRGTDGTRFDITPVYDEEHRGERIRQGMKFIEHVGSDEEFFAIEAQGHTFGCVQADYEPPEFAFIPSLDGDEEY